MTDNLLRRAALLPCVLLMMSIGAAAASAFPAPDADPFYAVPAGIGGLPNGKVLAARPIQPMALAVPMAARGWQVKYKTIDQRGRASAFVTTVLVPLAPWRGHGARPLVAYQVAVDALTTSCAPSYVIRDGAAIAAAGGTAAASNAATETANIVGALARGYAVEVPDWEGPGAEWISDQGTGHGVLDGIRAAKRYAPAGIAASAPVGLIGYSGGAQATDYALSQQRKYAPELRFVGAALGGIPASLPASIKAFAADAVGRGAIPLLMAALERSYPQWHVERDLSAAGQAAVASSQHDCLLDALVKNAGVDPATYEAHPGSIFANPALTAQLDAISPLGYPGRPNAPIHFWHAQNDRFAPVGEMQRLAARFRRQGLAVDTYISPVGDHISYVVAGFAEALGYLTTRFGA